MKRWSEMTVRERDAMVHQHVFGFDMVGFVTPKGYARNSWVKEEENRTTWIDVPEYSTDISAAWEIVERLDAQRIRLSMSRFYNGIITGVPTCWGVDFSGDDAEWCGTEAQTAPEAICIAALKAVGVEVEI